MIVWSNVISNKVMWGHAQENPVAMQIELQKWQWMGYTLSKDSSAIQQQAYECEPSKENVKEGDLERGGGEQYMRKLK